MTHRDRAASRTRSIETFCVLLNSAFLISTITFFAIVSIGNEVRRIVWPRYDGQIYIPAITGNVYGGIRENITIANPPPHIDACSAMGPRFYQGESEVDWLRIGKSFGGNISGGLFMRSSVPFVDIQIFRRANGRFIAVVRSHSFCGSRPRIFPLYLKRNEIWFLSSGSFSCARYQSWKNKSTLDSNQRIHRYFVGVFGGLDLSLHFPNGLLKRRVATGIGVPHNLDLARHGFPLAMSVDGIKNCGYSNDYRSDGVPSGSIDNTRSPLNNSGPSILKDIATIIAISSLVLVILILISVSWDRDIDGQVRIIATIGCALSCSIIYFLLRWNLR